MKKTEASFSESGHREWLLSDYFDTLVHRYCHPNAVKMLWAKEIACVYPKYSPSDWLKIRTEAERAVNKAHRFKHESSYGQFVDELYARIFCELPNVSFDTFYKDCFECDVSAECKVQYLDRDMVSLLEKAKKEGKKVAVVTDFYLPKKAFEQFFQYLNLQKLVDAYFVSSDLDARKSDGSLYDYVLEELSCKGRCSMIGDNPISDYKVPKHKGIPAVYRPCEINYMAVPSLKNIEKNLVRIKRKTRHKLFGGYAFLFYLFVEQLTQNIQKAGARDVFFLAREGQPLKEMTDWYFKTQNIKGINTHYLYASRTATLIAGCGKLEEEKFKQYFSQYPDVAPSDFLNSLGFNEEDVHFICEDAGVPAGEVVRNFSDSAQMEALRISEVFKKKYRERRQEQRKNFISYLDSFGVDYRKNGLFLVDVGWKGSIQDNIFNILDKEVTITGYYIGINGKTIIHPRNRKIGVVFSYYPYKNDYCEWFEQQTFVIEQLLSANHGPTVGYKDVDHVTLPIIETDKNNQYIFEQVRPIQKDWLSSMKQIHGCFQYSCYKSADLKKTFAKFQLQNVLLSSRKERKQKALWGKFASNNFGTKNGKSVQRSLKEKLKYFIRNCQCMDDNQTFELLYLSERVTGKLHCSWLNIFLERVAYWKITH